MKCSKCGVEFNFETKFCPECGSKLEAVVSSEELENVEETVEEKVEETNVLQDKSNTENVETAEKQGKKDENGFSKNQKIGIVCVALVVFFAAVIIPLATNKQNKNNSSADTYLSSSNSSYDDYDDEDEDEIEEEIDQTIKYDTVSLDELCSYFDTYNRERVTTTIKVTHVSSDRKLYSQIGYDYLAYDSVKVCAKFSKPQNISKGDFITVSGYVTASESDYYSKLKIIVDVDKIESTDKSLYDKIGVFVKPTEPPTEPPVPQEYKNALAKAESYNEIMHMSKQGLYDQLTSEYGENFPADAAQYAIDNLDADYKYNALQKGKQYYTDMNMSKNDVYDQLVSEYGEGFTEEEAQYAIDHLDD